MTLSDRDRNVLAFEAGHPSVGASKNEAIRTRLGISPARYYQILDRLSVSVEALALEPLLVRRLQRRRERQLV